MATNTTPTLCAERYYDVDFIGPCERPAGHEGEHQAHDDDGTVVVWSWSLDQLTLFDVDEVTR
jgi:hypothetical protein